MLKGIYFVLISTLSAFLFYVFFGTASRYEHPFFNPPAFSRLSGDSRNSQYHGLCGVVTRRIEENEGGDGPRVRRTVFILVSALILSALFPASAVVGLYPVRMAVFHLLILFYAGISLGAVSLSGALFLWRNGELPVPSQ